MDKRTWRTYHTAAYTYDVAGDQASQGGVHFHQIRRIKTGWEKRIVQTNGRHVAIGPVTPVPAAVGESKFSQVH